MASEWRILHLRCKSIYRFTNAKDCFYGTENRSEPVCCVGLRWKCEGWDLNPRKPALLDSRPYALDRACGVCQNLMLENHCGIRFAPAGSYRFTWVVFVSLR